MKRNFLILLVSVMFFASCTTTTRSIREPFQTVQFQKNDFDFSKQVTAEATTTQILGLDFERLFSKELAFRNNPLMIPIIGNYVSNYTANYALFTLLQQNPGYDAIFYPQYETKVSRPIGLGIYSITTTKVTARMAKVK